jgi:UDP-3-O-[3-hydroxymyristoyl] glucosamine N-acyltransferase
MRLSEISFRPQATVVRDAEFLNLGFFSDSLPGKLIFVAARRFVSAARRVPGVKCILCTPELASSFPDVEGLATAAEPQLAFFHLQRFLVEDTDFYGAPFPAEIHSSARIHPRASIATRNVRLGPDTIVEANVTIGEGSLIGAGVHVRAGAVLGAEGFQTARYPGGMLQMVHGGGLSVQDNVEIFSNAVIAKSVFRQMTTLGEHSRIGNGAFVSHNVQLGKRCFVGHNSTINGNTTVGDDVWIGPNATISNLLRIGEGSRISLGAVVIQSVAANTHVTGMIAIEHRRLLRHVASIPASTP